MKMTIEKLNIGFNADVKVVYRNEILITGDITATVTFDCDDVVAEKKQTFDSLYVIYNHDGLLEHVYDGESVPDNTRLFTDVETYVNTARKTIDVNEDDITRDILITDDNSINAEFFKHTL